MEVAEDVLDLGVPTLPLGAGHLGGVLETGSCFPKALHIHFKSKINFNSR